MKSQNPKEGYVLRCFESKYNSSASCVVSLERSNDMENKFTAVFEQDGDWWIGYVEELPGANAQGETLEEARENLREAAQLILEANRELARREAEGKDVIREELVIPA
jgi:predicted RNase H-like HicB family nuclease